MGVSPVVQRITVEDGVRQPTSSVVAFHPDEVSGLTLWLKGDALSGTYSDGDAVAAWGDLSLSSHDAFQSSAGQRPVYKANVLNGHGVCRFTQASAHQLNLTAMGDALSSDVSHSWFFVFRPTAITNYPVIVTWPVASSWTYLQEVDLGGGFYQGGNGGLLLSATGITANTWSLLSCMRTGGATAATYAAGTLASETSNTLAASPSMTGDMLLGGYVTTTYSLDGDIAEVLCFTDALSTTDRQKVEGYLAHRYAMTAGLPSDHPYKNAAP